MRRLTFFAITALSVLVLGAHATDKTVTLTSSVDSLNNRKVIVEVRTIEVNGQMVQDTVSITTYADQDEDLVLGQDDRNKTQSSRTRHVVIDGDRDWELLSHSLLLIPVLCILLPIIIVALILFFRYKNRQSRYRLIEKALESGQPLSEEMLSETQKVIRRSAPSPLGNEPLRQLRTKGVSQVAVGLGLFILLWTLTDSFALGCVGLLVLCIGAGKLVNYYLQMRDAQNLHDKLGGHADSEAHADVSQSDKM